MIGKAEASVDKAVSKLQEQVKQMQQVTNSVKFEEIMSMDSLADKINNEVSEVAFMTSDGSTTDKEGTTAAYDWHMFDLIVESQSILYGTYDRLAGLDQNA